MLNSCECVGKRLIHWKGGVKQENGIFCDNLTFSCLVWKYKHSLDRSPRDYCLVFIKLCMCIWRTIACVQGTMLSMPYWCDTLKDFHCAKGSTYVKYVIQISTVISAFCGNWFKWKCKINVLNACGVNFCKQKYGVNTLSCNSSLNIYQTHHSCERTLKKISLEFSWLDLRN